MSDQAEDFCIASKSHKTGVGLRHLFIYMSFHIFTSTYFW